MFVLLVAIKNRITRLFLSLLVVGLFWVVFSVQGRAQGPEICVEPQGHPAYEDITTINEAPTSGAGWLGEGDPDGDGCFGHPTTGGPGATYTKPFSQTILPQYHDALYVEITAGASAGRTGYVTARVGDGGEYYFGPFTSGDPQILSGYIAQGVTNQFEVFLSGTSNGELCITDVLIQPSDIGSIPITNTAFIDPHNDGVDWPAWQEVVSQTQIISTGSRAIGGVLQIETTSSPVCTPISKRNLTDTITIEFDAVGTENRSGNIHGAIVENLVDIIDSPTWGPDVAFFTTPSTPVLTATINGSGYTDGYLCLEAYAWGGSVGHLELDNFDSDLCTFDGDGTGCVLRDFSFSGDYTYSGLNDIWISPVFINGQIGVEDPPISGGAAQLGFHTLVAQKIPSLTIHSEYTVTFEAKYIITAGPLQNDGVVLGLTKSVAEVANFNQDNQEFPPGPITWAYISPSEYRVYTATLNGNYGTDINNWFYMSRSYAPGAPYDDNYIEVRWVCIWPSGNEPICLSPTNTDFDLNIGQNYGGLFEDTIGSSQGWKGVFYTDLDPTYTGPEKPPQWINLVTSPYASPIGLFGKSALNFIYGQGVAIEYQDFVIPNIITANVIYPIDTFPDFEVWIKDEDAIYYGQLNSQSVSSIAIAGPEIVEGDYLSVTVAYSFTNEFLYQPYNLALALKTKGTGDLGANRMGWNWIQMSGCFPGDPLANGDCLFADPELEEDSGQPSGFYWFGDYGPLDGRAYLEENSKIWQNISPSRAGAYRLEMLASSYLNGALACGFTVDIRDYSTYDIYKTYAIPCKFGLVQSYTINIELPAVPVEFMITQNNGVLELDSLCIASPDEPNCINKNPIFLNGIKNYSGDFTISDGLAVIAPGASIHAVGVPYGIASTRTFQLELTAQPVISGPVDIRFVTDNSAPTITSPGQSISSTTSISRVIAPLNVNSGTGPAVWNYNNTSGDDLAISSYCITALTSTVWYGGKNCNAVTNPDFDLGLTGWDSSNVINVGGWVTFDTGGNVSQLVEFDNLMPNPGFETGLDDWYQYNSFTVVQSTEQAKVGNYSAKVTISEDNRRYYSDVTGLTPDTIYAVGGWIYVVNGPVSIRMFDGGAWTNPDQTADIETEGEWVWWSTTRDSGSGGGIRVFFRDGSENNIEFYIDGLVMVAGDSVPAEYTSPNDATVHWIAKAPGNTPISATVTVSSTAGVFQSSHTIYGGFNGSQIFDNFTVGGDVEITVTGGVGLELDYVCLIPGTYTEPGTPGDGGDEPGINIGDGHCAPPPMAVISGTLNAWLPSIWIWENEATNYEVVGTYSAAWLRYIGCTLTQIAQLLDNKLTAIIRLLQALTFLQLIDTLASLIELVATAIAIIEEGIDDIIDTITGPVLSLLYILGIIALFFAALLGLLTLLIGLIALIWLIPQTFWGSFSDALTSDNIIYIPLPDSEAHPLYNIMVGLQMFNATFAPTWMYTFTIVAIALGSISIVIWTIKRVQVQW